MFKVAIASLAVLFSVLLSAQESKAQASAFQLQCVAQAKANVDVVVYFETQKLSFSNSCDRSAAQKAWPYYYPSYGKVLHMTVTFRATSLQGSMASKFQVISTDDSFIYAQMNVGDNQIDGANLLISFP